MFLHDQYNRTNSSNIFYVNISNLKDISEFKVAWMKDKITLSKGIRDKNQCIISSAQNA